MFLKGLENPPFSNSGVKELSMWGYVSGVKIFGEKVNIVRDFVYYITTTNIHHLMTYKLMWIFHKTNFMQPSPRMA